MRFRRLLLIVVFALAGRLWPQESTPTLDQDDAWLLVMSVPAIMEVECRKGCPVLEFHAVGKDRIWALATNRCPTSGNGTLGTYTVDLHNGQVWSGVDPVKVIDSDRLRRLREVLLSRQRLKSQAR
jgi:hypothetical protein